MIILIYEKMIAEHILGNINAIFFYITQNNMYICLYCNNTYIEIVTIQLLVRIT